MGIRCLGLGYTLILVFDRMGRRYALALGGRAVHRCESRRALGSGFGISDPVLEGFWLTWGYPSLLLLIYSVAALRGMRMRGVPLAIMRWTIGVRTFSYSSRLAEIICQLTPLFRS